MKSKILHVRQSRRRLWWLAPGLWALLLFVASSIPGTSYPQVSFAFADKAVHALVYGCFGGLLARALANEFPAWTRFRVWAVAAGASLLYGATDELHQAFVPNRSPDPRDLLADGLGAGIGAALVLAYLAGTARLRARHLSSSPSSSKEGATPARTQPPRR